MTVVQSRLIACVAIMRSILRRSIVRAKRHVSDPLRARTHCAPETRNIISAMMRPCALMWLAAPAATRLTTHHVQAAQLAVARRRYIVDPIKRERSTEVEDLLQICGFKSSYAPNRQELATAFKRELSKLVAVSRSPSEVAATESASGAASVIEPDEARTMIAKLTASSAARSFASTEAAIRGGDPADDAHLSGEAIRQLTDARIAALIKAYRSLSNSRFWHLYDSSVDASTEVTLGYKRSDAAFANFDGRRQEFFFTQTEAKPLADFGGAYRAAVGLERSDMEDAAASSTLQRAGFAIQFVLSLDFVDAFTGCEKQISVQKRPACRMCTGSGQRRRQSSRCPQCRGRGRVQQPRGADGIEKQCSLCLGSGGTLPPDCGACKGTGLSASTVEHRCAVVVPPGSADGDTVILRGAGNAGVRGGPTGSVFVTLVVKHHRYFSRDGADLHVIVPVPLSVVLTGGHVAVPVLDDEGRSTTISVRLDDAADGDASVGATGAADDSNASGGRLRAMASDRVIVVADYGMWRRAAAGAGIATDADGPSRVAATIVNPGAAASGAAARRDRGAPRGRGAHPERCGFAGSAGSGDGDHGGGPHQEPARSARGPLHCGRAARDGRAAVVSCWRRCRRGGDDLRSGVRVCEVCVSALVAVKVNGVMVLFQIISRSEHLRLDCGRCVSADVCACAYVTSWCVSMSQHPTQLHGSASSGLSYGR